MGSNEHNTQLEWSITFWTILPASYDTMQDRVLVQSVDGKGAYFALDETSSRMGCIDELTHQFIDAGIELSNNKKIKKGWHHIAVVCSRDSQNPQRQNVVFFLDATKTQGPQRVNLRMPIGYIGNSKHGDKPFGVVADLRMYPYPLSKNYLVKQSKYDPALEFEMPDKYLMSFI